MLKILGGKFKSRLIAKTIPKSIRPTSVILRRKVFDAHQMLQGYTFVDLFAGTGSMGLEAYSRGCKQIVLNELNSKNYHFLKKNMSEVLSREELDDFNFHNSDALKLIDSLMDKYDGPETIFFIDPPYEKKDLYTDLITKVNQYKLKGQLWIESCNLKGHPLKEMESLVTGKVYTHGDHYILCQR